MFVLHIFTNPYLDLFILYSMSFSMLFITSNSDIYTSNIEHVVCISTHCSALAI